MMNLLGEFPGNRRMYGMTGIPGDGVEMEVFVVLAGPLGRVGQDDPSFPGPADGDVVQV